MHELPVTEAILQVVLKHAAWNQLEKVVTVHLTVGRLCELEEEWIQHYFAYLGRGTIAAEAQVQVRKVPAVIACLSCGKDYEIGPQEVFEIRCPHCGSGEGRLISGREYIVTELEGY